MAIEVERRFLVANDGWRDACTGKAELRDGLILSADGRKVRVRHHGDRATITIKGTRTGLRREEYEYPIPLEDAEALFASQCDGRIIEKTRHFIPHEGHVWEVDVYHGALDGVVLAEIELESEDAAFAVPGWAGAEITHDLRYRKINMLADRLQGASVR